MTSHPAGSGILRVNDDRQRILAKLSFAELEQLVARPVTLSVLRWLRRGVRDAALRDAIAALFPNQPPTLAAKALARALDCYLDASWRTDRNAFGSPSCPRRAALHRIAVANRGDPLGWSRIHQLATAVRDPVPENPSFR